MRRVEREAPVHRCDPSHRPLGYTPPTPSAAPLTPPPNILAARLPGTWYPSVLHTHRGHARRRPSPGQLPVGHDGGHQEHALGPEGQQAGGWRTYNKEQSLHGHDLNG